MSLSANEKKILGYIREGRNSNADFTDNLGISAPNANLLCEGMEQEGYITRVSLKGINRFNWYLTDKGVAELDPLAGDAALVLEEGGINLAQFKILSYAKDHPQVQAGEIVREMKLDGKEMVSDLCFLVDHAYLKEGGLIRRNVTITDKGLATVKKFEGKVAF